MRDILVLEYVWNLRLSDFLGNIILKEAFFAVKCGQFEEKNNAVQNDSYRKIAKIIIQTYSKSS